MKLRTLVELLLILLAMVASVLIMVEPAQAQSEERIFRDGFGGDAGGGGAEPPPSDPCDSPLVMPVGWQRVNKTWQQTWSSPRPNGPQAVFPNSIGTPVPIGANKGTYTVVPFVMWANLTITITFDPVQSQPGYVPRPAETMYVAISECPGDFRVRPGLDPCAIVASGGSLFLSSKVQGLNVCRLEAERTYFMTVAPVNPQDGLDQGEHTCSQTATNSENGCDVQAVHHGN